MNEDAASAEDSEPSDKRMKLRYAGTCRLCGTELPARADAIYERGTKTVRCVKCLAERTEVGEPKVEQAAKGSTPTETGVAGSSARREYERRKAKDEERLREKWGRFGGFAVALSDERQSTKAWERGAVGEERLGDRLDTLISKDIAVLHDRRIPGTNANIDHIVVTRAAVWVIDAKRYRGRPGLKIEGGILRPRVERLLVGSRDCTKLVDGVIKQTDLVREVLGDVPVNGAMCFVEANWPLIGGSFVTRGIQVLWPKRLAKLLVDAPVGQFDVATTARLVGGRFPPS